MNYQSLLASIKSILFERFEFPAGYQFAVIAERGGHATVIEKLPNVIAARVAARKYNERTHEPAIVVSWPQRQHYYTADHEQRGVAHLKYDIREV
jgi:hypothetical protein